MAVKDPVVKVIDGKWHIWLCCHPLDLPDDTDRMHTDYGTSTDGLRWDMQGTALAGVPGRWDQRGARVADAFEGDGTWLAYYDGRDSKEQNAEERTGIATGSSPGHLEADGDVVGWGPDGSWSLRYTSVVPAARWRAAPLLRDEAPRRCPRLAHRVRTALAVGAPLVEVPARFGLQQRRCRRRSSR